MEKRVFFASAQAACRANGTFIKHPYRCFWVHYYSTPYIRRWQEADNKEPKRQREEGYTRTVWPRWNLGHGIVEYHPNQVRAALSVLEDLLYHAMLTKELDTELSAKLLEIVTEWFDEAQTDQFINHLAETSDALMQDPIGERQETDKAAIEEYLIHLPNRQALASIQQITHTLQTLPLPAGVSPAETSRRIDRIQEQTRYKYCRLREDIEAEIAGLDTYIDELETDTDGDNPPAADDESNYRRFEEL